MGWNSPHLQKSWAPHWTCQTQAFVGSFTSGISRARRICKDPLMARSRAKTDCNSNSHRLWSQFKDLNLSLRHHFSYYQSSSMIYLLKMAIFHGKLLDCQRVYPLFPNVSPLTFHQKPAYLMVKSLFLIVKSLFWMVESIFFVKSLLSISLSLYLYISIYIYLYIYISISIYRHAQRVVNHQCFPLAPLRPPTRKQEGHGRRQEQRYGEKLRRWI